MMRALFVAMMFLSISAMAQTGPCSAGIQDPPIFSVMLGSPVLLSFQHTTDSTFSPPVVTVVGHNITALQLPAGANQFPVEKCDSHSVSLGDLAPGLYTVTWNYQVIESPGPVPPAPVFSFAFTVPDTVPCVRGIKIQPQSPIAGQPVAIVYSIPFRVFFQTPSVAIDKDQITIDEPAFIADPAFPGHVPCARGAIQIGSLQSGYYTVIVRTGSGDPLSVSFGVQPLTRVRAVRAH